jgi:hypothetical protein
MLGLRDVWLPADDRMRADGASIRPETFRAKENDSIGAGQRHIFPLPFL